MSRPVQTVAQFIAQDYANEVKAATGSLPYAQPLEGSSGRVSQSSTMRAASTNTVAFSNITLKPDNAAAYLSEKAPQLVRHLQSLDGLLRKADKHVVADAAMKMNTIKQVEFLDASIHQMQLMLQSPETDRAFSPLLKQSIEQLEQSKLHYEIAPHAAEAERLRGVEEVGSLEITPHMQIYKL